MDRREFLKCTAGAAAISLSGCRQQTQQNGNRISRQRPNIIFLLTDDQRADAMGCAGNPYIVTPEMDRLAAEGIRFSNAFVTTAICCTSRASIFSGQYARRHGIHDFATDFTPQAWAQTYPAILRQAGYRTGFVGKFGVGTHFPADEFDVWQGIGGQPTYEHTDAKGNYRHLTQIMGDQSIDFLKRSSPSQPFCLSVSFKAPHVQDADPRQFIYDRRFADLYANVDIPKPPASTEGDFNNLPPFLRHSVARTRWHRRFATESIRQEMVKGYYRLVTGVDEVLGRIRRELQKLNLTDNTIIIFHSDNGFYLGEFGLAGKWYPHEVSIHVPLIIFDPRMSSRYRGRTFDDLALNIDIAPTLLDMADVDIPQGMQGRSLTPFLHGRNLPWRNEFFYEHLFEYPGIKIPRNIALRTERYKYMRFIDETPPYEMLFDLQNDPHETTDLARKAEHAGLLETLRTHCDIARLRAG